MGQIMLVQKFIKEHGLQALTDQLSISVKKYPNGYVKLGYSQIDSPKNHPVVNECRGLILFVDDQNNSKVIARSFNRFYNYGECDTKDFDFSNCTVWEKLDGSMVQIYWSPLDNCWNVGTRGMVYAEGNFAFSLTESTGTFKDWILRALGVSFEQLQTAMESFPKECTYTMEYCGPENQVVTPYPESFCALLAVTDNETGKEEPITNYIDQMVLLGLNVRKPNTYQAKSGDDLVKLADTLDGLKEGFVVYDHNTGNRVKVKSKTYCAVHHLRGNGVPSMERLMEVVLMNEQDELISYFPTFKEFVDPIVQALQTLIDVANTTFMLYCDIEDQKEFALKVKDTKVNSIMFKARKDKTDAVTAFRSMELNQQIKLLEKFI